LIARELYVYVGTKSQQNGAKLAESSLGDPSSRYSTLSSVSIIQADPTE
jgi:hypothetical protein